MGLAKARMMELEELEASGALAEFTCPNPKCRQHISEYVVTPMAYLTAEKQSDITVTETTEVQCEHCGTTYFVTVSNDSATLDGALDEHPDVNVHIEPPDWYYERDDYEDNWLYAIYDAPQSSHRDDSAELDAFVAKHCSEDTQNLNNRMALMQAWSIFETYLADQLATYLANNKEALIRFARNDSPIKDLKLDAAHMLEQKLTVTDEIVRAVKDRLFHKLGKPGVTCSRAAGVPKWYGIGVNIEIEPDLAKLDRLRFFAGLRHDCVHRNGRDRKGDLREDLTKTNIIEMRSLMDGVVTHISETIFTRGLESEDLTPKDSE